MDSCSRAKLAHPGRLGSLCLGSCYVFIDGFLVQIMALVPVQ